VNRIATRRLLYWTVSILGSAVLLYYAIANASAWTLGRRLIPAAGLAGCVVLASNHQAAMLAALVLERLHGRGGARCAWTWPRSSACSGRT